MTEELVKLKEYIQNNRITDFKTIRYIISDLVLDISNRELLFFIIDKGILQAFFTENNPDEFFINRHRNKILQDYHLNKKATELVLSFCMFLIDKPYLSEHKPNENSAINCALTKPPYKENEIRSACRLFKIPEDPNLYWGHEFEEKFSEFKKYLGHKSIANQ